MPWISPKDMKTGLVRASEDQITRKAVDEDGAVLTPAGSILVVVRSGILVHTFPVALTAVETSFNQDLKAIRVNRSLALPEFVFRFLQAREKHVLAHGVKRGATVHSLKSGFLETMDIGLPPKREQGRIVELLEQADVLRRKREEADRAAQGILPALFRKMFGEPARSGGTTPLASLVEEFRYGTSNRSDTYGKPTLRIPNVVGQQFDLGEIKLVPVTDEEFGRLQLRDGDMLFVRTNGNPEYVGRSAVFDGQAVRAAGFAPDQFIYASYLIRARLRSSEVNPHFVEQYLMSPPGKSALRKRTRTSAGQFNINTEGLGAIPIPRPPLHLQQRFANFVFAVRSVGSERAEVGKILEDLFANMLHRAFTGDLTADWRQAHLRELLAEMDHQALILGSSQQEMALG